MKRSKAIRTILTVLKEWEGSRLEAKTARQVLAALEALGMRPPLTTFVEHATGNAYEHAVWEPEK